MISRTHDVYCFRTTDIAEPLCSLGSIVHYKSWRPPSHFERWFAPHHANKTVNSFQFKRGFDSSIISTSRNSGISFRLVNCCECEIIVHANLRPFCILCPQYFVLARALLLIYATDDLKSFVRFPISLKVNQPVNLIFGIWNFLTYGSMWPRLVPMESGHNRTDEARIPGQSIPCFRDVSYMIGLSLLLSPLWRILRLSH